MNIEIGNKPIGFVFQGDELIYPNYVAKENLVLHYDFSGRTNLDVKKGIAEDLSGNGNDGILENFAYESGSGYDSNSYLEFDNVDDFIIIPELNLDVNNFTVAVNGEVLSYRGDNVAKMNENGLEIGGRNLIPSFTNPIWGGWDNRINVLPNKISTDAAPLSKSIYADVELNTNYILSIESNARFYVNYLNKEGETFKDASYLLNTTPILFNTGEDVVRLEIRINPSTTQALSPWYYQNIKLEKGTIPTDWTPASEDLQTTKITPIFSNKIKTLMYWNRALTDTELQEVYNVQKHRI